MCVLYFYKFPKGSLEKDRKQKAAPSVFCLSMMLQLDHRYRELFVNQ